MTVDLVTQLERYGSVMDTAVPPLDVESLGIDREAAPRPLTPPTGRLPRRPAVVTAAAFAGVLVAGLLVWGLAHSGRGAGPVDEPTITPTTSALLPADAEIDPELGVPYEPVIPFHATIELSRPHQGDFVMTNTSILQVSHGGLVVDGAGTRALVGLRIDVLREAAGALRPDLDAPETGEGAIDSPALPPSRGSYLVIAEGHGVTYLADRGLLVTWLDGPYDAGELTWRTWARRCSVGDREVLGPEVIAGRDTTHIRCKRASGTVEVWIDIQSGLVLQSRGDTWTNAPLIGDNLGAFPPSFTVTDLSFEPGTGPFDLAEPEGADVIDATLRLRRVLAANPGETVEDLIASIEDQPPEHPLVGTQAPPLARATLSGTEFDLAAHRGTRVVVLWWASWCPPALEALEVIQATSEIRDDLVFVAAAFQDVTEGVRDAIDTNGITVDVIDASRDQQRWGISLCPTTFLIEADGTVGALLQPYDTVEELVDQL